MGFESRRMQKLSKLFGEIEARRHTERRSPSYKDAPALREIATITAEELLDASAIDMGTIDDAVMQWAAKTDGIIKKVEKNRYVSHERTHAKFRI